LIFVSSSFSGVGAFTVVFFTVVSTLAVLVIDLKEAAFGFEPPPPPPPPDDFGALEPPPWEALLYLNPPPDFFPAEVTSNENALFSFVAEVGTVIGS